MHTLQLDFFKFCLNLIKFFLLSFVELQIMNNHLFKFSVGLWVHQRNVLESAEANASGREVTFAASDYGLAETGDQSQRRSPSFTTSTGVTDSLVALQYVP